VSEQPSNRCSTDPWRGRFDSPVTGMVLVSQTVIAERGRNGDGPWSSAFTACAREYRT
jgi:hypothetical protein